MNEHRNDDLAEHTEGVGGIHHHKTRDANCAGSREQGVQRGNVQPRVYRKGQHQQRRAAQNQQCKAQRNDTRRGLGL